MDKFVENVSDAQSGLKNALLFYLFAVNCACPQNWGGYVCKNLIEHYNVLGLGDDSRKIDWDKDFNFIGYKQSGWKPLSVARAIVPVIIRNDQVLLRIIFKTGAVKPTDCLTIVKDCHPIVRRAFVRSFIDERLLDLDENSIYKRLMEILRANKGDSRELPIFTQLYPQILNWRFDSKGNHVAAGTPKSHHLLMYAILRHSWNCAYALADKEILLNWWSITDDKSQSPFEYVNYLLTKPGHCPKQEVVDNMKQFYCDLWDKAVVQGARLDRSLSPENKGYRSHPVHDSSEKEGYGPYLDQDPSSEERGIPSAPHLEQYDGNGGHLW